MNNKSLTPQNFFPSLPLELKKLFEGKSFLQLLNELPDFLNFLSQSCCSRSEKYPEGVHIQNPEGVYVEEGVFLEPGIVLKGPCYLSKGSRILQGAYIREYSYVGGGVLVGHGSEVKHSFLLPECALPHFNYVGDSLVGPKANLGAGVKLANLRLDRKPMLWPSSEPKDASRVKLGAVIGHSVQVGCNSVINPGALLFPKTLIPPLSSISGIYGEAAVC